MEDAGRSYERGLICLATAKRMLVVARKLDAEDKELVRRLADGLVSKGTSLLTEAVRPARSRGGDTPPTPHGGSSTGS